jgi:zinc protease
MKKNLFLILALMGITLFISAQDLNNIKPGNALYVEQYTLKNGLTVYLNEDHTQPNILGAVVVKGGSKRDPADATGIAHYFEHIMFKGTDKLGTIDYQSEKVYLDSIRIKYDELGKTTDKKERQKIQIKINDLSVKAGDYAIPNEFDKVLSSIGGTMVNAMTSEENIIYFNMFPSNQIEKWVEIYSSRFINPVFRLFQSELETVYEEKNMSMDNFFGPLFETFNKNFFRNSAYGQQTVLGSIEHLKNPSLSKMEAYFNTYYVANNMALVLTGDFNSEEIKPLIEQKFGLWRTGVIPPMPNCNEDPFKGREQITKRMSPIKIGIIGYRTVPQNHPDENALEVCNNILSNNSQTGLFDKLFLDNKIMGAGIFPYQHTDVGGTVVFFIPKMVGQSLKKAEKMIMAELDKVKKGEFDEELLLAIKVNLKKQFYKNLENMQNRGFYLTDCFMMNKSWEQILKYPDEIDRISKKDVIDMINKYYNDNYLVFYSKTGFPKKDKIKKPPYKPILPKNSEKKSEFASKIESMKETVSTPRFIEFNPQATADKLDVRVGKITDNVDFYYTPDPINRIFNISIKYRIGTDNFPMLDQATTYFSLIGTEKHSFLELSKELQKIGAEYSIYTGSNYVTVSINGLDENIVKTLQLINELLTSMKPDDKQLKKLEEEIKANKKVEIKDPSTVGQALIDYAMYKDKSDYINRMSLKEVKKLKSDTLISLIKYALRYQADVIYSGSLPYDEVSNDIATYISFQANPVKAPYQIEKRRAVPTENTVYFVNDKKAIQSQIYLYAEGNKTDENDRTITNAFNEYFGTGMFGLVFQEIREFRSFAYSSYAYYYSPFSNSSNGYLLGSMSTQADKTIDAINVFDSLIVSMPKKPERTETIKKQLLQSINANRTSFRYLASSVIYWKNQGYNDDPRKQRLQRYNQLNFEDIVAFYNRNIAGKKLVITVVGDKRRINLNELEKFGKVYQLKKSDIFRK